MTKHTLSSCGRCKAKRDEDRSACQPATLPVHACVLLFTMSGHHPQYSLCVVIKVHSKHKDRLIVSQVVGVFWSRARVVVCWNVGLAG